MKTRKRSKQFVLPVEGGGMGMKSLYAGEKECQGTHCEGESIKKSSMMDRTAEKCSVNIF